MENITFRTYTPLSGTQGDYAAVREFLVKRGYCAFTYARWDWMITHSFLKAETLGSIGLWLQDETVVALATFDCAPGRSYLLTLPGYEELYPEMVAYAKAKQNADGVFVAHKDEALAAAVAADGYEKTSLQETDLAFYPRRTSMEYQLPEGYRITDLEQTPDYAQYGKVLWKGFNHEKNGEGSFESTGMTGENFRPEIERVNVDPTLKVVVLAPDGSFAAYCGMWWAEQADFAVVEPVATVPEHRGLGLGRAAVLEGCRRVAAQGATRVVVGSSQQFYHAIGFKDWAAADLWTLPGATL